MALREVIAKFGVDIDASPLEALSGGIDGAIEGLRNFGRALATGLALNSVKDFAVEMAHVADEVNNAAVAAGMTAQQYQLWQHSANMSGVAADNFSTALRNMRRNVSLAANGGKEQARAFREMGISLVDSQGNLKDTNSLLLDLSDAFSSMDNSTEKSGLAMRIFGNESGRMSRFLSQGRDRVEDLRKEFEELGGGVTQELIDQGAEYNDGINRLNLGLLSLKSRIGALILPVFNRLVDGTVEVIKTFLHLAKTSKVFEVALGLAASAAAYFGVTFLASFAAPLAIAAVFAIAIGFIIVLIDDLLTLFDGGKSVIGGFIDEMFGAGTAAGLVQDLKDAWEGVVLAVTRAWIATKKFFGQEVDPSEDPDSPENIRARNNESRRQMREQRQRQAARDGVIIREGNETREQAQQRFFRMRREAIESGEVRANQQDVEQGTAVRTGRFRGYREGDRERLARRQADFLGQVYFPPRQANVRTPNSQRQTNVNVNNNNRVNITVPNGTNREQIAAIERAVNRAMDQNLRSTAASVGVASEEQ